MRMRPKLSALTAAVGLFTLVSSAHADRAFDLAGVRPTTDPYSLLAIERAQVPQQFEFGVQTLFGWAHAPFHPTLTDPRMGMTDQVFQLIENQYTLDVGFYFGLTRFLSIAAVLPMGINIYDFDAVGDTVVPGQPTATNRTPPTSTSGLYRGLPRQTVELSKVGLRDPRLAVKIRFYGGTHVEVGMLLDGTLPLGDQASFLGEKTATFQPKLLVGFLTERLTIGLNLGATLRQRTELFDPYVPTTLRYAAGHDLTFGVGLAAMLHRIVSIGAEGLGSVPLTSDMTAASVTLLGTVYLRPAERWRVVLGGGAGVLPGNPQVADGRLHVSLAYSLAPREGGLR